MTAELKKEWDQVASLRKLKDGEEARVQWPSDADQGSTSVNPSHRVSIPYRYGHIEVAEIPARRAGDGSYIPAGRGKVFFVWEALSRHGAGRIEIEMPKQVDVKRVVGGSRRLG